MREVVSQRLWIGNAVDARDVSRLYELEIAAVVDLAIEELPAQLGRDMIYCRFPLYDGAGNPTWLLRAAIDTAGHFLRESVNTLVACSGGMSRSPAIVAAVLASERRASPDDCLLEIVADQPHDVSPLLWQDVKQALLTSAPPTESP